MENGPGSEARGLGTKVGGLELVGGEISELGQANLVEKSVRLHALEFLVVFIEDEEAVFLVDSVDVILVVEVSTA